MEFVDLGASKKCELIATSALVVMACGIADKWKQPLVTFWCMNLAKV